MQTKEDDRGSSFLTFFYDEIMVLEFRSLVLPDVKKSNLLHFD